MSVRTVIEMFDDRAEQSAEAAALRVGTDGEWTSISWRQWQAEVHRVAHALIARGVQPGDRVLLIARNRPEWVIADLAIMRVCAVVVPIHPGTLPKHCTWMARDAEARCAVVEDSVQLQKFFADDAEDDTSPV